MARPRSAIQNWSEYLVARCVLAMLRVLPRSLAEQLSTSIARLLDHAIPRLRGVARRNLQLALPALADPEALIDEVFASIGRILTALAKFPSINRTNVHQWIRYEGLEHLEQAHARSKGVIFATGHLGNWELSAFAHALLSRPMNVVVRPLDNPLLEALVEKRRSLSGNSIISKREFLRPVLKALARNEAVGILIDHNTVQTEGDFVDFFGIPACSNTGLARLAARSGAAVVPGFAFWSAAEQRYVLTFYPEIAITGDALADTASLQRCVEQAVRAHPGQWLWIHRRWKTRPSGEPDLYGQDRVR